MQISRQDAPWDFVVSIAVMTHARLRALAPEHRGQSCKGTQVGGMMIGMMEIPGYDGHPLVHEPELLQEPLFWLGHLYSCAHDEDAEELLFGADYEAAEVFHRELRERAE